MVSSGNCAILYAYSLSILSLGYQHKLVQIHPSINHIPCTPRVGMIHLLGVVFIIGISAITFK